MASEGEDIVAVTGVDVAQEVLGCAGERGGRGVESMAFSDSLIAST